jgi:hypothetical protein
MPYSASSLSMLLSISSIVIIWPPNGKLWVIKLVSHGNTVDSQTITYEIVYARRKGTGTMLEKRNGRKELTAFLIPD